MLKNRAEPVVNEYKKDITLMNEELTINVIEEEKQQRKSSPQLRQISPQSKYYSAPINKDL
mgnify:CR=1 FL=1